MDEQNVLGPAIGVLIVVLDRFIGWLRNRRKEEAETGLTVDQRWENYTNAIEKRMNGLETRVRDLEAELKQQQERNKGLAAEVDRYRRIARSLARHVLRLRDALAQATGGEVPAIPPDIEDALSVIELTD